MPRDWSDLDEVAVEKMAAILKGDPPSPDECLLWHGSTDRQGYGRIWVGGRDGRNYPAHRLSVCVTEGMSYVELDGWLVRHQCNNPPCYNPHHLLVGDDKQNVLDRVFADRTSKAFGEANPRVKLTDEEVFDIRALASKGWRYTEIAKQFDVSAVQIGRIVRNKQRQERV